MVVSFRLPVSVAEAGEAKAALGGSSLGRLMARAAFKYVGVVPPPDELEVPVEPVVPLVEKPPLTRMPARKEPKPVVGCAHKDTRWAPTVGLEVCEGCGVSRKRGGEWPVGDR